MAGTVKTVVIDATDAAFPSALIDLSNAVTSSPENANRRRRSDAQRNALPLRWQGVPFSEVAWFAQDIFDLRVLHQNSHRGAFRELYQFRLMFPVAPWKPVTAM